MGGFDELWYAGNTNSLRVRLLRLISIIDYQLNLSRLELNFLCGRCSILIWTML